MDTLNAASLIADSAVLATDAASSDAALALTASPIDNVVRPPLSPDTGGRSIGGSALISGDVIVSTTSALRSRVIRIGSFSPISHSAVYIGDGLVVEALGEGVTLRTIDESTQDNTLAVAFRYVGLTLDQAAVIRDYLGRQLSKHFAYVGVVMSLLQLTVIDLMCPDDEPGKSMCLSAIWDIHLGEAEPNKFFCSMLVVDAYKAAGAPLTNEAASAVSPGELIRLTVPGLLQYVGHLVYKP